MGVATTLDASKSILTSKAVQHLYPSKFFLGSPADRVDAIIKAVLVKPCSGFLVGHKVAGFMRNCFLRQDGTLTSLVRAVKMALVQHFLMEPLSFTVKGRLDEESEEATSVVDAWPKQAFDLPSCSSACMRAGKKQKTTLLDLYYEALDPKLYNSSHDHLELKPDSQRPSWIQGINGTSSKMQKGGLIGQTIRQVRDLSPAALLQLVEKWSKETDGVIENRQTDLGGLKKIPGIAEQLSDCSTKSIKSIKLLTLIVGNDVGNCVFVHNLSRFIIMGTSYAAHWVCNSFHMQPIECIPFHEIVCFKNVDKLQASNTIPSEETVKEMQRKKFSNPSPKKRKKTAEPQNITEASVQARFCRAVTELQITGLLRMPSKRRPDFVQRVAFGL
ncbi:origin of replication complex subunit 3 isoform X1 [Tanacetum coccineum]